MTYKAKIICFKSRYYTFKTTNFNPKARNSSVNTDSDKLAFDVVSISCSTKLRIGFSSNIPYSIKRKLLNYVKKLAWTISLIL